MVPMPLLMVLRCARLSSAKETVTVILREACTGVFEMVHKLELNWNSLPLVRWHTHEEV